MIKQIKSWINHRHLSPSALRVSLWHLVDKYCSYSPNVSLPLAWRYNTCIYMHICPTGNKLLKYYWRIGKTSLNLLACCRHWRLPTWLLTKWSCSSTVWLLGGSVRGWCSRLQQKPLVVVKVNDNWVTVVQEGSNVSVINLCHNSQFTPKVNYFPWSVLTLMKVHNEHPPSYV